MYQEQSRGRISVHRLSRYSDWHEAAGISKRSVDSVHLPQNTKDVLLQDAESFSSAQTRRWYSDRGIPYRRGYLLYGTPGSGKSSMCHVLASELERPIYVLNLATPGLDDQTFLERMSEVPAGSIVLMEDIDAAFVDRAQSQSTGKDHDKQKTLSFSAVLNAIDGIGASEGRLLCMTTNHYKQLDPALIRPGRIDMQFEFTNASQQQAKELFIRWYGPRDSPIRQTTEEEIQNVKNSADQFCAQIPNGVVSVAALQGFLLSCGNDDRRALREVGPWIDSQKAILDHNV